LNEARKIRQTEYADQIKMMKDQMKKIYFKKGQMISFALLFLFNSGSIVLKSIQQHD
jgi:DNA-binding Xre family transcriptional regulator